MKKDTQHVRINPEAAARITASMAEMSRALTIAAEATSVKVAAFVKAVRR